MKIIYEPKGRAREYAPLAANLYSGCAHGCEYCYVPGIRRKTRDSFRMTCEPRKNVLQGIRSDAMTIIGDPRPVLLCFMCDPYQEAEKTYHLTRDTLRILSDARMRTRVLTKNPGADFPLMAKIGTELGITALLTDDADLAHWEPHAPHTTQRIEALREAHGMGITTWCSIEPVIDPEQAIAVLQTVAPWVDYVRIGKLNHFPHIEAGIDWAQFGLRCMDVCREHKLPRQIKHDLWAAMGYHGDEPQNTIGLSTTHDQIRG